MMKKTFVIVLAALSALVSCHKELIMEIPADHAPATEIVFNLTATHPAGDGTKAVKTGWETGDVIFVFFQEVAAPKYLKMTYDGSSWSDRQMNGGTEEALGLSEGETVNMRAVFLPFGNQLTVSADGDSFVFSELQETYYLTAELSCTVTGSEVSGNFDMRVPDGYVQFFINLPPELAFYRTSAHIELREPQLTPQGIASIAADGTITHTPVIHGAPLKGYFYNKEHKDSGELEGVLFSGILDADSRNVPKDYHLTLYAKNGDIEKYAERAYTGKQLYRGADVGRALLLTFDLSAWTELTDYLPVDLACDVPVGTGEEMRRIYWSSRNLGASRSDRPASSSLGDRHATWGDYYAWGATEPFYTGGHAYNDPCNNWKSGKGKGYHWESYPFMSGGYDWKNISKYTVDDGQNWGKPIWYNHEGNFVGDNLTILERGDDGDDAASKLLGGIWRMPTAEEWKALMTNCDWTWDDDNKGLAVTIKGGTPWTDPTIFLPAAGERNGDDLAFDSITGYYWSSSLYPTSSDWGQHAHISENTYGPGVDTGIGTISRYIGMTVRPVRE